MIRSRNVYTITALCWGIGLWLGHEIQSPERIVWVLLPALIPLSFMSDARWSFAAVVSSYLLLAIWISGMDIRRKDLLSMALDPSIRSYAGIIKSPPEPRTNSQRVMLELLPDSSVRYIDLGVYLYFSKDDSLGEMVYGDTLVFHASLECPDTLEDFDYRGFLKQKGIFYTGFVRQEKWKCLPNSRPNAMSLIFLWRQKCLHALEKWDLAPTHAALLQAILLGVRKDIPEEVKNDFAEIGVIHVMAVSGLHLGIWFLGIRFLLNWLPWRWRKWRSVIVIPVIWIVALIAGASPSAMRAATMFSMLSLQEWIGKGRNALDTVMLSMILLSCLDLDLFFQLGFQLSYLAVMGIILIYPWLDRGWDTSNSLLRFVKSLGGVSISAQIMTTPLALYYFHRFPMLFLPANMLIVPLITILVYLGFIGLIFQLFEIFPMPIVFIIKHLLNTILWITSELSA